MDVDAFWQSLLQARHLATQAVAELDHVGALVHGDGDADGVLPGDAHTRCRRVGEAALDGGDVAQPEQATAGLDADLADAFDRGEITADAKVHAVGCRFKEAGRRHRILLLQGIKNCQRVKTERRQLGVRHLDKDFFFLNANQLNFLDVGDPAQFARNTIGFLTQYGQIKTVAGEREDIDESVAELIVHERPLHAGRQGVLDVADLLAHLVPRFRHLLLRRVVLDQHEDQRLAGFRAGADDINPGHFLQLFFDAFGDLHLDFARRGARPHRPHDHGLEGEVRVFGTTQLEVGKNTAEHQDDDQIGNHRTVAQRPLGKIEVGHRATGVPLTDLSPGFRPLVAPSPPASRVTSAILIFSPLLNL